MIIQNCPLLLVILTKIESLIVEQRTQQPHLNDEEIIEYLKNKFQRENRS